MRYIKIFTDSIALFKLLGLPLANNPDFPALPWSTGRRPEPSPALRTCAWLRKPLGRRWRAAATSGLPWHEALTHPTGGGDVRQPRRRGVATSTRWSSDP